MDRIFKESKSKAPKESRTEAETPSAKPLETDAVDLDADLDSILKNEL